YVFRVSYCVLQVAWCGLGIRRLAVSRELYFWLPALTIGAGPVRGGGFVADQATGRRVELEGVAATPGDIAQMAEESAALAVFDFCVERGTAPDPVNEVGEMNDVIRLAFEFSNCLVR